MGLFSSVLHVRDTQREALLPALDVILRDAGFSLAETLPIGQKGPRALPKQDVAASAGPCYLISQPKEHWLTVIEAHLSVGGAPNICEVGERLSAALACETLALIVHDDDLFFYSLAGKGESLDGYNSCPQYFEQGRMPDEEILEQRHAPDPFRRLLPPGRTMEELQALLNRGWWNAYDSGRVDDDGMARGENDGFVFEGERMTAFGTLLQLHASQGEYPYAAWGESSKIQWSDFVALRYRQ